MGGYLIPIAETERRYRLALSEFIRKLNLHRSVPHFPRGRVITERVAARIDKYIAVGKDISVIRIDVRKRSN